MKAQILPLGPLKEDNSLDIQPQQKKEEAFGRLDS